MAAPTTKSFIWPFPESTVSSDYGPRPGVGKGFHDGIDFGYAPALQGATIVAVGDGTVTDVWIHPDAGPYAVDIDHGGGFHSQYWHCASRKVSTGQKVKKEQAIGTIGALGLVTGPHLHLQINGPESPSGRSTWPWRDFYKKFNSNIPTPGEDDDDMRFIIKSPDRPHLLISGDSIRSLKNSEELSVVQKLKPISILDSLNNREYDVIKAIYSR